MSQEAREIQDGRGELGVLLPGMGAVASTFIAGVELVKRGLGEPYGSVALLQTLRLGKRYEGRNVRIRDMVPLQELSGLRFAGWDLYPDSVLQAATKAAVLPPDRLAPVRDALDEIRPLPAVYDAAFLHNLEATNVKSGRSKMDLARQVMTDIEDFREREGLERMVMVWCGSTEILPRSSPVHRSLAAFERGLKEGSAAISPSMIYAYAALQLGIPFANGAPNLTADVPALVDLAERTRTPIAGKDFKTGQTLMKTVLAPGLRARMLGVAGWYSTNILGNRDGEVLNDPGSFRTKERSKLSVLESILDAELNPELYGNIAHKVRIDYYPPRGDAKESWDNIDIFGWLGMPMQIKLNFLCRDSVLAAPIVLDLVLFLDLAKRAGLAGIQEWLSFYFKSPQCRADLRPENDLFIQQLKLQNTLRLLAGEEVLDHTGLDYYDPVRGTPPPAEPPRPAPEKDVVKPQPRRRAKSPAGSRAASKAKRASERAD